MKIAETIYTPFQKGLFFTYSDCVLQYLEFFT